MGPKAEKAAWIFSCASKEAVRKPAAYSVRQLRLKDPTPPMSSRSDLRSQNQKWRGRERTCADPDRRCHAINPLDFHHFHSGLGGNTCSRHPGQSEMRQGESRQGEHEHTCHEQSRGTSTRSVAPLSHLNPFQYQACIVCLPICGKSQSGSGWGVGGTGRNQHRNY